MKFPFAPANVFACGMAAALLASNLSAQTEAAAASSPPKPAAKSIAERAAEASAAVSEKKALPLVGEIIDAGRADRLPQVVSRAPVAYPFEMRRANFTGQVVLQFVVDKMGDVRDVAVVSSTREEFEAAAIQSVSQWKFIPAMKGGKEVNVRMQVPIVFQLSAAK